MKKQNQGAIHKYDLKWDYGRRSEFRYVGVVIETAFRTSLGLETKVKQNWDLDSWYIIRKYTSAVQLRTCFIDSEAMFCRY